MKKSEKVLAIEQKKQLGKEFVRGFLCASQINIHNKGIKLISVTTNQLRLAGISEEDINTLKRWRSEFKKIKR